MSAAEQQLVKYSFFEMNEFPLVLGDVDYTLISIKAPTIDEQWHICKKGCLDIYIWNNCQLTAFETGKIQNGWHPDDTGYSFKPWFLKLVLSRK
jgi:hypothetical protein